MSGGLDNVFQVDVRWSGYVSFSGVNQRVIWRSGVHLSIGMQQPDIHPGIDVGLEIIKFRIPG